MSALKLFCLGGKLISTGTRTRTVNFVSCRRITGKKGHSIFDFKSQVDRDVLLFSLEKPKTFFIINAVSFVNCICWTYIGYFIYGTVKNTDFHVKSKFLNWLYTKERQYSDILSCLAFAFGVLVFLATSFYTNRSVRRLLLHKGGRNLTIVTYSLFGSNNIIKVPISEVSATLSRNKAMSFIPLKLKNRYFYFFVDVKGEFKNPMLFDCTAGIARNF